MSSKAADTVLAAEGSEPAACSLSLKGENSGVRLPPTPPPTSPPRLSARRTTWGGKDAPALWVNAMPRPPGTPPTGSTSLALGETCSVAPLLGKERTHPWPLSSWFPQAPPRRPPWPITEVIPLQVLLSLPPRSEVPGFFPALSLCPGTRRSSDPRCSASGLRPPPRCRPVLPSLPASPGPEPF